MAAMAASPKEASWHRNLRRKRSAAKFAARVAQACMILNSHHGSAASQGLVFLDARLNAPTGASVPLPRWCAPRPRTGVYVPDEATSVQPRPSVAAFTSVSGGTVDTSEDLLKKATAIAAAAAEEAALKEEKVEEEWRKLKSLASIGKGRSSIEKAFIANEKKKKQTKSLRVALTALCSERLKETV